MKKIKKWLGISALCLTVLGASGLTASAELSNYTGETRHQFTEGTFTSKEGNTIEWDFVNAWYGGDQYDTYRTILIDGVGALPDFAKEYCAAYNWAPMTPWNTDSEYNMLATGYAFVGEGITSLGNFTFNGLGSMMYVTLPESLTSIGDYAFRGCCNLIRINIPSVPKAL